jgi:hypothetical protein
VRDEIERALPGDAVFSRSVIYPAVSLGPANLTGAGLRIGRLGKYHDSVTEGKRWMREQLRDLLACEAPKSWIVLIGYSQGAQVIGDVFQGMTSQQRDRVVGVVLFGDPYFNGRSLGGVGSFRRTNDGVLGRRPRYRTHLDRVRSYCDGRDYVCQGDYASKITNARFIEDVPFAVELCDGGPGVMVRRG